MWERIGACSALHCSSTVLWTASWWGRGLCEGWGYGERWGSVESDKTIFKLKTSALHYLWGHGFYLSDLEVKDLKHVSVAEFIIHFWKKSSPACEMLCLVEYVSFRTVVSAHHRFTNMIRNMSRIFVDEVVQGRIWRKIAGSRCCNISRRVLHWWRTLCWSSWNQVIWCWVSRDPFHS